MNKITVYGLPLNPMPALEQLKGASFCVSYGTRQKLGKQLDQAIELVGAKESSILLVDNGAYSAWQKGINTMTDEAYLEGFAEWANDITDRCPQAIVVLPDVIDGTMQQNADLAVECTMMLNAGERLMPIWHMHEPISYLLYLCEGFNYIGFGSSGDYAKIGTDEWHARMREAFAAIDAWEIKNEGAYVRPRIHLMRAQAMAHLYPFDSSDSTNLAMNHKRAARNGSSIAQTAKRIDGKIQASAGPAAPHQVAAPLTDLHTDFEIVARAIAFHQANGNPHGPNPPTTDNADGLDIPDFLRRAA